MSSPFVILLGGLLGLIVGSFVGALVVRWPRGESVARGRSHCDRCGAVLGPADLVPVLSFVLARGCCRRCGAAIDPQHLAAELACALVGATAFAAAPPVHAAAGLVFGCFLVALALLDARHFWLPDALTLPLALLGIAAAAAGSGPPVGDRVIGACAGYAALAAIAAGYRALRGREGLGGGDPKLLAAIGAWLGWMLLPLVLLLASLTGLAFVLLAASRGKPLSGKDRVPLGTLMALAAWPVWLVAARSSML